jgi:hypothetical protein
LRGEFLTDDDGTPSGGDGCSSIKRSDAAAFFHSLAMDGWCSN